MTPFGLKHIWCQICFGTNNKQNISEFYKNPLYTVIYVSISADTNLCSSSSLSISICVFNIEKAFI